MTHLAVRICPPNQISEFHMETCSGQPANFSGTNLAVLVGKCDHIFKTKHMSRFSFPQEKRRKWKKKRKSVQEKFVKKNASSGNKNKIKNFGMVKVIEELLICLYLEQFLIFFSSKARYINFGVESSCSWNSSVSVTC